MHVLRTTRSGWLLGGFVALVLAACGYTQTVGATRTIQIGLTEYRLSPQRIRARPGSLTLLVHNFGHLTHNLALTQGGRITAQTRPIRPGASAVLTVLVTPGSYVLASTLLDDQPLGAYGSLIVAR